MIVSFRCAKTEALFRRAKVAGEWDAFARVALRKLYQLQGANTLHDLSRPPANRLEKLKGNRKDQYSIRINRQWRICFRFEEGQALDVEIVDYLRESKRCL